MCLPNKNIKKTHTVKDHSNKETDRGIDPRKEGNVFI